MVILSAGYKVKAASHMQYRSSEMHAVSVAERNFIGNSGECDKCLNPYPAVAMDMICISTCITCMKLRHHCSKRLPNAW